MDLHFAWHFCVAGVALGDIHLHFAWQARHLATSTGTLRGSRGTWWHPPSLCVAGVALMALGWLWSRAWFPHDAVDAAAFCVGGVALGYIHLHFPWQARHLATSTFTLHGRRGAWWHPPSLCVAGVGRGADGAGLALLARLVPRWRRGRRGFLRGRRGAWRHPPSLCVVSEALGDIQLCVAGVASTVNLRGRRGTYGTGLALQARLVPRWRRGGRGFLRGRRGTWRHPPSLCVVGVALGDIHLHFAWQVWHLVLLLGSKMTRWTPAWKAWRLATSTFTLRGRRGTWWHRPSLCVVGMALLNW